MVATDILNFQKNCFQSGVPNTANDSIKTNDAPVWLFNNTENVRNCNNEKDLEKKQQTAKINMEKTVKTLKEKACGAIIEKIIEKKLNSKADDLSAISFNPLDIKIPSNEGHLSIHNKISGNKISFNISLIDGASGGFMANLFGGADNPDIIQLNENIDIEIPKKLFEEQAKKYLTKPLHFAVIKKMQPRSSLVLETTNDGKNLPVVTAFKDRQGKIILEINKNGLESKIEIKEDEIKR